MSERMYICIGNGAIMASIKYRLIGKSDPASIYLRFTLGRKKDLQLKTGLATPKSNWNAKTHLPKERSAESKSLKNTLMKLEAHVFDKYNDDYPKGITIDKPWLEAQLLTFFNRGHELLNESKDLKAYIDFYNEKSKTSNKSKTTLQKYVLLKSKLEAFEKYSKKNYKIEDFNEEAFIDFKHYLMTVDGLMLSTASRTLKNLKTVLRDARKKGYPVAKDLDEVKTPTISGHKVWLSFDEIEQIENTQLLSKELKAAKDWLIIGCYTGQRVSDLLRMNKDMIVTHTNSKGNSYEFIELVQTKNREKKNREGQASQSIAIPIHPKVKAILNDRGGNFPESFSDDAASNATLFNRYIKKVAEIAGIHTIVQGKVYNDKLKRHEITTTEKCYLISSHVCRRSFATNFYGDNRFTTPQLMAITGHKQESVFLQYIGKTSADHAMKTAETFAEMDKKASIF